LIEISALERKLRGDARAILDEALKAADAGNAVRSHLSRSGSRLLAGGVDFDLDRFDRVQLLSIGKAAVSMALAVAEVLGDVVDLKVVVTKEGHAAEMEGVAIEAGHPLPNASGEAAAEAIRKLLEGAGERDLIVVALSGGASALLPAPALPVKLADKQQATDLLLRAGANIHQLNAVRKHLSFLKGGQLAKRAWPATTIGLLLSDVLGDPLDVIGSGPTAPDSSTFQDALEVLRKFGLLDRVPASVRERLVSGAQGELAETPKAQDEIFGRVHNVIVGSNRLAIEAAAQRAESLGYRTTVLSTCVEGEARDAAKFLCDAARPEQGAWCFLAGGETTVTVRGGGKGGRNQELALAAALELAGAKGVAMLSAGTDGTDGPTDAAGAIATGTTIPRANALGMQAEEYLERNDSYPFFEALGDLIKTGPTGTNVMDVQILLTGSASGNPAEF
jgi:glycerate 2-kinase